MYFARSVLRDAIKKELTHLGQMEFPTLIIWTSLFQGLWVVGRYFHFIQILIEHSLSKQWNSKSDAAFCDVRVGSVLFEYVSPK